MGYRWRSSKKTAHEFAEKMDEIADFCIKNGIDSSTSLDSFYFEIDGVRYRVRNHSGEASNRSAFDAQTGEQRRGIYHHGGRHNDVIYIHASKTRIIQIYNDLKAGYKLNGRGNRIVN